MIRADILDRTTGLVLDSCAGADEEGYCPRQHEDGHLPCAGGLLDASAPFVGWHLQILVPEHARKCPLRGFARPSHQVGEHA